MNMLTVHMQHIATVCLFMCWSHGLAFTKMAELIEMLFGGLTHVGPSNHHTLAR